MQTFQTMWLILRGKIEATAYALADYFVTIYERLEQLFAIYFWKKKKRNKWKVSDTFFAENGSDSLVIFISYLPPLFIYLWISVNIK